MAYIGQDKKKEIAAELKKIIPEGWKYSLGIRHHSTLVLTISEAPVNLIAERAEMAKRRQQDNVWTGDETYMQVSPYWLDTKFEGERLEQMKAIVDALNNGNHDRSDIQTDYFDVGWYIDIKFGRYDKPFKVTG